MAAKCARHRGLVIEIGPHRGNRVRGPRSLRSATPTRRCAGRCRWPTARRSVSSRRSASSTAALRGRCRRVVDLRAQAGSLDVVLLTVTTTHRPATDLGFLLHKHPDRVQTFDVPFGEAHVFYPEAAEDRCTAALLSRYRPGRARPARAWAEQLRARASTSTIVPTSHHRFCRSRC